MKKEQTVTSRSLRFWLEKKRMRQSDLAALAEVEPSTVSQIVTGQRKPSMDLLERLAGALELSLEEFFSCRDASLPDVEFVPLVKARPRAGSGGLETDSEVENWYSFHSSFLARKRGTVETMRLFMVDGDSMEPTLSGGDMIMVNLSMKDVVTGAVYLLRIGDELMVKRLENRPGGILLIRSDNPAYEDIPIKKTDVDGEVEVFGRMVWSCREY